MTLKTLRFLTILGFSFSSGLFSLPAYAQSVFIDVDVGSQAICAIRDDSTVTCNTVFANIALEEINNLPSVQAVDAGSGSACAIETGGNLQCFGSGAFNLTNPPSQGAPYQALSVATAHGCAINSNNGLECWGIDSNNRLDAPEGQYTQLSVSTQQACALDLDGGVACWGANDQGTGDVPADLPPAIKVVSGFASSCALLTDGTIQCWGRELDPINNGPYVDFEMNAFGSPDSGSAVMCGIDTNGEFDCRSFDYDDGSVVEVFEIDIPQSSGNSSLSLSGTRSGCFINNIGDTECFGFIDDDRAPGLGDENQFAPPTTGLRSLVYSASTIELFWDAPGDAFNVRGHEIRRNDDVIEFTGNLSSYVVDGLEAGVTETFAVRRVDLNGSIGEFSDPISVTSQIGGDPNLPPNPADPNAYVRPDRLFDDIFLDAFIFCSDFAELFWEMDTSGIIDGVELYRDGTFVAFVEEDQFDDFNIVDGSQHNYVIIAIDLEDPERFHGFATATLDITDEDSEICNPPDDDGVS